MAPSMTAPSARAERSERAELADHEGSRAGSPFTDRSFGQDSLPMRVALATCAEVPAGDEDAPAMIGALAARGVEASPAIWDDESVDWAGFDLVVVRSTWDYPDRRKEFLAWAESLPHVLNAPDVLRWNTDKRYLESLPGTVRTEFLEPGAPFTAPETPFVVKPSVGAGSIGAARYDAGDARAAAHVGRLHEAGKTVMVQPYLDAVDHHGEVALLYLGGELSHAVRKEALLTRVGEAGAGLYLEERISATQPASEDLELGERVLAAVPFDRAGLLYARVDLLPGPVVLELELTEPSLFLGYGEGAKERFADAITAASQRRRSRAENGPITSQ
jgi:glutathione synthase/RimK-type ligase-like ATP-grasp enzyme